MSSAAAAPPADVANFGAVKNSPPTGEHPALDIDGMPIKDGKKIDLKSILGHMPEIDDDEDVGSSENKEGAGQHDDSAAAARMIESQFLPKDEDDLEFGESDDDDVWAAGEEEFANSGQRKRRSSLKTLLRTPSEHPELPVSPDEPSPPTSPDHAHKNVRFADSVGLGLADVRDLVNADEPPEVPASALRDLHVRRRKRSKSQLTLELDFDQPGSSPTFVTRVLTDKVALENCIACSEQRAGAADQLTISGVVRVANVAFDKRVLIRYTTDGWVGTSREVVGSYLVGSNDGATDRFAFVLHPSAEELAVPGGRLEFAVLYEAGGTTYWDNNSGSNYGVTCGHVHVDDQSQLAGSKICSGSSCERSPLQE